VNYPLGRAVLLDVTFYDPVTNQPADPPLVVFNLTDPTGAVSSATWNQSSGLISGNGAPFLTRTGTGQFQYVATPGFAGLPWRWQFLSAGTSTPAEYVGAFGVVDTTVYPYPFGYCDISDIQSRITAGSWSPLKTGAWPTLQQAQEFILEAAAAIDTVLARTGYFVPLQARSGMTIAPQVYQTLLDVNAAYAVASVEKTRHGAQDVSADENAAWWLQYADNRIARIEGGDDNLWQFGLDGPFPPVPDMSVGMLYTGITDSDGNPTTPYFSHGMVVV
jgi:hypothetical protein